MNDTPPPTRIIDPAKEAKRQALQAVAANIATRFIRAARESAAGQPFNQAELVTSVCVSLLGMVTTNVAQRQGFAAGMALCQQVFEEYATSFAAGCHAHGIKPPTPPPADAAPQNGPVTPAAAPAQPAGTPESAAQ